MRLGQVNCSATENMSLCQSQSVTHYPTLYFYDSSEFDDPRIENRFNPLEYEVKRDLASLNAFLQDDPEKGFTALQAQKDIDDEWQYQLRSVG